MVRNRLYCTQHIFVGKNEEEKKQKKKEKSRYEERGKRCWWNVWSECVLLRVRQLIWLRDVQVCDSCTRIVFSINCEQFNYALMDFACRLAEQNGCGLPMAVDDCLEFAFSSFTVVCACLSKTFLFLFFSFLCYYLSFRSIVTTKSIHLHVRPRTDGPSLVSYLHQERKGEAEKQIVSVCVKLLLWGGGGGVRRFLPLRLQPDFSQIFCFHHAQKTVLFSIQSVRRQFFLSPFSFSFLKAIWSKTFINKLGQISDYYTKFESFSRRQMGDKRLISSIRFEDGI